jgi:putative addiction module killer protein
MSYQVRELLLPDGKSHFADCFTTLDAMAAAKIRVATFRMEQGNLSNVEWFRGIGEYKIDWGPGYRIYLANFHESRPTPRMMKETQGWRC